MFEQLRAIKGLFHVAGTPGYMLVIYFVVQILFSRTKTDMAAVDMSALIFAAYAMICGIYAWRILGDDYGKIFFDAILKKTPVVFFFIYTLWCLVSSLWSPNLVLTAYRVVECFGLMLLNMAAVKKLCENAEDEETILQWSALYGFFVVILQFWKGARISLGMGLYTVQFPATIFFYLAIYWAPNKWVRLSVILAAILCESVTGYLGIALGLVSLLFGERKYRFLGFSLSVIIVSSVALYGVDKVLDNTVFSSKKGVLKNGQLDENKTSGRTKIWENAINRVNSEHRTWYGFGFVVGEMQFVRKLIGNQVIGMHNGFLSAYVGTGLIGAIPFAIFMLGMILLPIRGTIPKKYKAVLVASMCVVLVHTLGNPGLGFRVYGTWMPAMYIVILTCAFYLRFKEEI